jgi:hypothetical protein
MSDETFDRKKGDHIVTTPQMGLNRPSQHWSHRSHRSSLPNHSMASLRRHCPRGCRQRWDCLRDCFQGCCCLVSCLVRRRNSPAIGPESCPENRPASCPVNRLESRFVKRSVSLTVTHSANHSANRLVGCLRAVPDYFATPDRLVRRHFGCHWKAVRVCFRGYFRGWVAAGLACCFFLRLSLPAGLRRTHFRWVNGCWGWVWRGLR